MRIITLSLGFIIMLSSTPSLAKFYSKKALNNHCKKIMKDAPQDWRPLELWEEIDKPIEVGCNHAASYILELYNASYANANWTMLTSVDARFEDLIQDPQMWIFFGKNISSACRGTIYVSLNSNLNYTNQQLRSRCIPFNESDL